MRRRVASGNTRVVPAHVRYMSNSDPDNDGDNYGDFYANVDRHAHPWFVNDDDTDHDASLGKVWVQPIWQHYRAR